MWQCWHRELNLDQVKYIYNTISEQDIRGPKGDLIRIEMFAHGALCMAVSGKVLPQPA